MPFWIFFLLKFIFQHHIHDQISNTLWLNLHPIFLQLNLNVIIIELNLKKFQLHSMDMLNFIRH